MSPRLLSTSLLAALLATGAALAGCVQTATNPHPHDFVLEEGQRYEKNPDVTLAREYWIIVVARDDTRFMLPRPDGDPRIVEECRTKSPLAAVFDGAKLCESATATTLARVNALTRSEAMQVSTFLHRKLRFVATAREAEGRVEPHPLTSDLLDLCKAFPQDRNGALRAVCDRELGYESKGARPAIYIPFTLEESRVIASRLNEMYGIP